MEFSTKEEYYRMGNGKDSVRTTPKSPLGDVNAGAANSFAKSTDHQITTGHVAQAFPTVESGTHP
jgi:hypothetical protein